MSYASTVLASTPTAYWTMDDISGTTMLDSSGNGYNGTYSGPITLGINGALFANPNRAVYSSGATSIYSTVLDQAALNPGAGEYAIEFWMGSTSGSVQLPFAKNNATSPNYDGPTVIFNQNTANQGSGGVFQFRERDGGSSSTAFKVASTTLGLNDGRWRHYVAQRRQVSPGTYALEIYVNGANVGSTTLSTVIDHSTNTSPIKILGGNTFNIGMNGSIDEIAYYVGKALTPTEILAHYNANPVSYSSINDNQSLTVYTGTPKQGTGYGLQNTSFTDNQSSKFKNLDAVYQPLSVTLSDSTTTAYFMSGSTVFQNAPLPFTKVNLYDRRTGVLLRSAVTDANGKWSFLDLYNKGGYFAAAIDPDGFPLYNSIIYDKLSPVPYSLSLGGSFSLNSNTGTMDGGATIDSGMPPFTQTIIAGSIPPGLTLSVSNDRDIIASGTSSFYQDYYFTVKVVNGQGYVAQKDYQALLPTSFGKSNINTGEYFNLVFAFDSDLYFNAVNLKMSMDTLKDNVNPSVVWTARGATTLQSATSRFGASSLYVPTDNNNIGGIITPYNTFYDMSITNDWTIECWVNLTDPLVASQSRIIFSQVYTSTNIPIVIGIGNDSAITGLSAGTPGSPWVGFYNISGGWNGLPSKTGITVGSWYHLAFTRKGNLYSVFINGVLTGRGIINETPGPSTQPFMIGKRWDSGAPPYNFGGYIDDFRLTKGICRYDKNFTVPNKANPNSPPEDRDLYWDQVGAQLTFENGNMSDDTGRTLWSLSGSTVVSSSASLSGSYGLLFDGNVSGYASIQASNGVPLQVETDPFTIDLWFKLGALASTTTNGYCLFAQNNAAGNGEQMAAINPDGTILFQRNSSFANSILVSSSAGLVNDTKWHHYAVTYDGSTLIQYLDGVSCGTISAAKGWTITSELFKIGNCLVPGYSQYQKAFKGSIDNFRITRGVVRWTDNFTPSTFLATTFDPDDVNHHVERFLAQPLKNLSTNTWTDISVRYGTPTITWNSSGSNPYLQILYTSYNSALVSFDRWGTFTGNYWFEMELEMVADNAARHHFGFYLDSGNTGCNGYRLSHLDGYFVASKWVNSTETTLFSYSPDSMSNIYSNGLRYNLRVEVNGSTIAYFFNGMFAGRFTDTTFTGLRPGLHVFGATMNVRKVETGSYASPLAETPVTPPLGYNVAFGRRSWLTDPTLYANGNLNSNGYREITDQVLSTSTYLTVSPVSGTSVSSIVLDLESVQMINQVIVWHYWLDSRVYQNTKTEVSIDGLSWTTIFDSAVSGTYTESATGHVINFSTTPVRYIKDTGGVNSTNSVLAWTEIQASLN